jgi:hypothetical protein
MQFFVRCHRLGAFLQRLSMRFDVFIMLVDYILTIVLFQRYRYGISNVRPRSSAEKFRAYC